MGGRRARVVFPDRTVIRLRGASRALSCCLTYVLRVLQELAGPNSSWIGRYRQSGGDHQLPQWTGAEVEAQAPALKSGGRILITGGGGNIGQLMNGYVDDRQLTCQANP